MLIEARQMTNSVLRGFNLQTNLCFGRPRIHTDTPSTLRMKYYVREQGQRSEAGACLRLFPVVGAEQTDWEAMEPSAHTHCLAFSVSLMLS